MAKEREASAWLNACRMSGQNYFFVEGIFDLCFWKKFIDRTQICIQNVQGWENVLEYVNIFNNNGYESYCVGVIDSDFEKIHQYKKITVNNVFMTDYHDTEMMIYHSDAFVSAIQSIDRRDKIKVSPQVVINDIFNITNRIGYLKLTSLKNNLHLLFKRKNNNHGFDYPNYEQIIDKSGNYLGDEKLVLAIYNYTNTHKTLCISLRKPEELLSFLKNECINIHDKYQLSNGHDVSLLMHLILKKKYNLIENTNTIDIIEIILLSAYNFEYFKATNLYKSIFKWSNDNKKDIFNHN